MLEVARSATSQAFCAWYNTAQMNQAPSGALPKRRLEPPTENPVIDLNPVDLSDHPQAEPRPKEAVQAPTSQRNPPKAAKAPQPNSEPQASACDDLTPRLKAAFGAGWLGRVWTAPRGAECAHPFATICNDLQRFRDLFFA